MQMATVLPGTPRDLSDSSILCVIDMTERSEEALHSAANLAGSSRARLTVLYPYRLNQATGFGDISQWKKNIDAHASNSFSRMSALLSKANIDCDFKPEVGFLNDRVNAFAQKNKTELIVIGKHLAESNGDAFLQMLEDVGCPVLIVPGKPIS